MESCSHLCEANICTASDFQINFFSLTDLVLLLEFLKAVIVCKNCSHTHTIPGINSWNYITHNININIYKYIFSCSQLGILCPNHLVMTHYIPDNYFFPDRKSTVLEGRAKNCNALMFMEHQLSLIYARKIAFGVEEQAGC